MAIPIFKRREIVRLLCMGGELSNRRISTLLGVSSGTVNMIASQLPTLGMTWEQLKVLDDNAFLGAFIKKPESAESNRPRPDCLLWHMEMERDKDVTLRLLWEEWHAEHPDGISYPQATRLYKQWLKKQRVSMRKVHHPGERSFVDFAGRKLPIYDRDGKTFGFIRSCCAASILKHLCVKAALRGLAQSRHIGKSSRTDIFFASRTHGHYAAKRHICR